MTYLLVAKHSTTVNCLAQTNLNLITLMDSWGKCRGQRKASHYVGGWMRKIQTVAHPTGQTTEFLQGIIIRRGNYRGIHIYLKNFNRLSQSQCANLIWILPQTNYKNKPWQGRDKEKESHNTHEAIGNLNADYFIFLKYC